MFFGILTMIVFTAWVVLIALQPSLNLNIDLIQGVEKTFYLMIGAFSTSLIEHTKKNNKRGKKK